MRWLHDFPRLPEMPFLKELQLNLHPLDFHVHLTNFYLIPWHQLRVLTLTGFRGYCQWSSQMLLNILQRCKSLVECTLWVNVQGGQQEHIFLPNLESLVLRIDSGGSADHIILSLTLPILKSLDIKPLEWTISLNTEAIVIMAHRSGFKRLTHFSLCHENRPIDVGSLLGSMSALKSVTLPGRLVFQPGTLDDLSSGAIGPQLENIKIGIMNAAEIALMFEAVGQRHEKAKTVSDIRPFAFVTCWISGFNPEPYYQLAKQCGEAFNLHVGIINEPSFFLRHRSGVRRISPLEESNAGEESHSYAESESHEESYPFGAGGFEF